MQVDLWKALFDRGKHVFVELDPQIGVQAALHQNTCPAQFDRLLDFFVDRFEREEITVPCAERTVERTERTVFGAEVRVIDVAVDLVRRDAGIGLLAAHFVRRHPDANQVIGLKQVERFLWRQTHSLKAAANRQREV